MKTSNNKRKDKLNYMTLIISAIISAIIGGLFTYSFSILQGPQKVQIVRNTEDVNTLLVKIQPIDYEIEQLTSKTSEVLKNKYKNEIIENKPMKLDSMINSVIRDFKSNFDSLRKYDKNNSVNSELYTYTLDHLFEKESNINSVRSNFKLPSTIKGYLLARPNSLANISLNSNSFKQNDKIEVNFELFKSSLIKEITPLFIDLTQRKSDHTSVFVWGEKYDIKDIKSKIVFSSNFNPGEYELTIGFYMKNEIDVEYPTMYANKYYIEIK